VERDTTKALQSADHRREGREQRELLDLPIQFVPPLPLVRLYMSSA
jgi:hypothetical protein